MKILIPIIAILFLAGVFVVNAQQPQKTYTVNEWRQVQAIYQYEIGRAGGTIRIRNVRSRADVITKFNQAILARPVDVGALGLERAEYEQLRARLLQ